MDIFGGGRGDSLLRCLIYRQSVRKVRTVVVAGHLNPLGGGGDSHLKCLICRQLIIKMRALVVVGHLDFLGRRGEERRLLSCLGYRYLLGKVYM